MGSLKLIARILASTLLYSPLHAEELIPPENIEVEILHQAPVHGKGDTGSVWASSVLADGEAVVFGWFNPENQYVVGKWEPNGKVQTTVIGVADGRVHDKMSPSLGLDSRGHYHLSAGMHNGGWQYWVSDQPHSIDSFAKITYGRGTAYPPGDKITYPRFTTGPAGALYLSYRTRSASGGLLETTGANEPGQKSQSAGLLGGALAKSTDGQTWESLGANAPMKSPLLPVLIWESSGRSEDDGAPGWYQTFRNKANFDAKGNLHYAGIGYGPGSRSAGVKNGATYLIYAKSRDGGKTYEKADGSPVPKLPLTSQSADLLLTAEPGDLSTDLSVGADRDGNPIIFYEKGNPGEGFMARWTATKGWVHQPVPVGEAAVIDSQGRITGISKDGSLLRSTDLGETWQVATIGEDTYTSASDRVNFDPAQALHSGQILLRRIVRDTEGQSLMQVIRVTFKEPAD